ncbi:MAG TPA: DedA family protein [Candidatus Dormibacteraeota bacterium]|nr:DedA family protein [Candidatus Dormibacteraeota bacterium]
MDFLTGLHGAVATVLICVLLFIDEAGVPLPFIPNEVLLIVAGLLIAAGSLNPFIFYPFACLALFGGSFSGYSWAKAVGPRQLRRVAGVLHATRAYDRATRRLANADARHLALSRVIPGIRVYATLCAGSAQVPVRTFWEANVPAILSWVAVMTGIGFIAGVPAEHLLTTVEAQLFNFALSGALLVGLGVVAYRAARRTHDPRREPAAGPFFGIARRDRYWLAFAVDAGIVATVVAGFDRLTRAVLHFKYQILPEGRYDVGVIVLAIALVYILLSRRSSTGETTGERLFDVSYVHRGRRPPVVPDVFDDEECDGEQGAVAESPELRAVGPRASADADTSTGV